MARRGRIILLLPVLSGLCCRPYTHEPVARIDHPLLVELSGMQAAATGYWGHNDSGHAAAMYRFDRVGKVRQRVILVGATNRDWESMTRDSRGRLYVGDIGDNGRNRKHVTILRFAEPAAGASQITGWEAARFVYPDQRSRNCEALFHVDGRLYLISKEAALSDPPGLFRIDRYEAGLSSDSQMRRVGTMQTLGMVTGADHSVELGQLAVLTVLGVTFFRAGDEAAMLGEPFAEIRGFFGQCEAVCYDGREIILSNEKGALWRFPAPEPPG